MNKYDAIVYEYLKKNTDLPEVYTFAHRGKPYIGLNTVFSPLIFEDTFFFAEKIPFSAGDHFLEVGCGTGLISVNSISQGCRAACATDINPDAIKNTCLNAILHGVEHKMKVFVSDVFDQMANSPALKFDIIFWNTPFIYSEKKQMDMMEKSVFDENYSGLTKYLSGAKFRLRDSGRLFIGFSSSSGDPALLNDLCRMYHCSLNLHARSYLEDFSLELYEIIYN